MTASKTFKYLFVALLPITWSPTSAETCKSIEPNSFGMYMFRFPDRIGDLQLYEQSQDNDPRLGYTTTYEGNDVRLNIFIYNNGIENIPDGVDSDILRSHYEEVKAQLKESGAYSRVTLQSERHTSFGSAAIPALEAHYSLQTRYSNLLSFIYVTAKYRGFIKLRLSMPVEKRAEMMTVVSEVRSAMGDIFCASDTAVTVDSTGVIAAIDRMFGASSVIEAAEEIPEIVEFAAFESAPVQIVISDSNIQLTDDINVDTFFMGFYLAGAIKYDLEHPDKYDHPTADVLSGIRAMFIALRIYKAAHPSFEYPFVERLATLDAAGDLEEFARSGR